MGLEDLHHNFLTGRLEDLVKWARPTAMWPATFGLACCAIEMMAVGAADFDISRFGMEVFRASPRQADLMIVAGRVSQKMAPVLRQVYDQMMEPKWVISMGVCASTGGMFNNYAIVQGVDEIVPVDVYAPGLPADAADVAARHPHAARKGPHRGDHPPARRAGRAGARGRLAGWVPDSWPAPSRLGHAAMTSVADDRDAGAGGSAATSVPAAAAAVRALAARRRCTRRAHAISRGRRLKDGGFEMCADLCAVDYLTHPAAVLPEGVAPERFEVVVNLLSLVAGAALRLRVQVPEDDPIVPTLFDVYPGTEAMEREAYDMFGIVFAGHPDLTRILMPEDWEGHPLRKDYGVGRVPVQFKDARGRDDDDRPTT